MVRPDVPIDGVVRVAATCLVAALTAPGCTGSDAPMADSLAPTTATTAGPTTTAAPLAEFAGMWSYESGDEHHNAELCGYLIIEEPYVHVLETAHGWDPDIDPGLSRNAHDEGLFYHWINLPRSGTRYDPRTRSIWVWDDGPMTDGDHVSVGGSSGAGASFPSNVHHRHPWLASSMAPSERPC